MERVIVCNTRGRGEISSKNDRVDVDRLSELLRLGALKPVDHGATALLTLKELVRSTSLRSKTVHECCHPESL